MDKAGAALEKLERRMEASARKGGVVKGRSVSLPFSSPMKGGGGANDDGGGDRRIGII